MNAYNPWLGERISVAWRVALAKLQAGQWESWADLVTAMSAASGILPKSASNLLHQAVGADVIERRGKYTRRAHEGREVRLLETAPELWLVEKIS